MTFWANGKSQLKSIFKTDDILLQPNIPLFHCFDKIICLWKYAAAFLRESSEIGF
jgi:hypothetical protein